MRPRRGVAWPWKPHGRATERRLVATRRGIFVYVPLPRLCFCCFFAPFFPDAKCPHCVFLYHLTDEAPFFSFVSDCLHLQLYRDSKDRCKLGHTKASLSLQHFLGVETGKHL